MNAASNAYSIRSCPCSSLSACFNSRSIVRSSSAPTLMPGGPGPPSIDRPGCCLGAARNGRHLRVDVLVDAVDALADALDRGNRDQRDEAGQKRVLNQVLAFIFPHEPLNQTLHHTLHYTRAVFTNMGRPCALASHRSPAPGEAFTAPGRRQA